ncbi:MAG: uroporphyrinogen-III C-methyltransferase [Opitutaceae bacterium]|jgi:uroporphyrin-III C-methyltransferase/precorrin-2 dehydrogenase/sirohydrochlorin ferrochelatase
MAKQRPPLYPLFLDLSGRDTLLVGAGKIALRKARDLIGCGAHLRVVAPVFDSGFSEIEDRFQRLERPWKAGDEEGARLVVVATSDQLVNRAVYETCSRQGILCNVVDAPELCDFHVPAVARSECVQIAIGTGGGAPSLSSFARRKLLDWIADGFGNLVGLVAKLREESQSRIPLEKRERFWKALDWERWLDLLRRDGSLACEQALRERLDKFIGESTESSSVANKPPSSCGRVILVGAGPGHPDLITRMGLRALGRATALVYDRLVSPELLQMVPASCQMYSVGKKGFGVSHSQDSINDLLVGLAQKGHFVVRLKGGDPFVFGRGGEEIEACQAVGIPVEVVPGLSSSLTVPVYAGIPITHRGLSRSFAIVSGHHADGSIARIPNTETVVVMMPLHSMRSVRDRFLEAEWLPETPCVAIQAGTTDEEHIAFATLASIDRELSRLGMKTPLIVVVGSVAGWAREHRGTPRLFSAPRGGHLK